MPNITMEPFRNVDLPFALSNLLLKEKITYFDKGRRLKLTPFTYCHPGFWDFYRTIIQSTDVPYQMWYEPNTKPFSDIELKSMVNSFKFRNSYIQTLPYPPTSKFIGIAEIYPFSKLKTRSPLTQRNSSPNWTLPSEPFREEFHVVQFLIDPALQNAGYGNEALDVILKISFNQLDVKNLSASTCAENWKAKGMLKKRGFTRIDEKLGYDDPRKDVYILSEDNYRWEVRRSRRNREQNSRGFGM
ncbi:hypothetical protein BKA69DRAFT_1047068 [Paraphysoderma sedebokerense]|nr:hypothetical protein BKA69DRAFT_1047068 [Paraphysoderma sedebokerense]